MLYIYICNYLFPRAWLCFMEMFRFRFILGFAFFIP